MATTTTNFGWAIPQSTDLVKDGATAIATLGQAIDTTANTTFRGGLTKISTTSFSAVTSVTVNPFSATYDDYKVVVKITAATAATDLLCQLSSGATPLTTASYDAAYMVKQLGVGAFSSVANSAATSWILSGVANTSTSADYQTYDFSNPFAAKYKSFNGIATRQDGYFWLNGGRNQTTTSYDGLKFSVASGTITGSVTVYGYSK
jgi:predicted phage tail protein